MRKIRKYLARVLHKLALAVEPKPKTRFTERDVKAAKEKGREMKTLCETEWDKYYAVRQATRALTPPTPILKVPFVKMKSDFNPTFKKKARPGSANCHSISVGDDEDE